MINHFIGESFSYDDIETTNDPNILYKLNVLDQYIVSAVSISKDDIKLIITNQEGRPVNIRGDLLPYEEPYVVATVSGYINNRDNVIKSQMLKIADDLLSNLTEEVSVMPDKYLDVEELKSKFPFVDGSSDPNDCLDTLEELGYYDVELIDDEVYFRDATGTKYLIYVDRVGPDKYKYIWQDDADPTVFKNYTGTIYPDDPVDHYDESSTIKEGKVFDKDELMNTDPFGRGWSTNPYDAVEALKDLGYVDIDMQDDRIVFYDANDHEYTIFINRVGQNTFQYTLEGFEYEDADDYLDDSRDPKNDSYLRSYYSRMNNDPEDEEDVENDIPSPALPPDADDEEYEDADDLLVEVRDTLITVGLYGDSTGEYASLSDLISKLQKAGLIVTEISGNEDYGWEMNVSGPAKVIYKMINYKVPGYNVDSLQDFIDQYSIDIEEGIKEDTVKPNGRARKKDLLDALKYLESEDIILVKDQKGNYYDIEDLIPDVDNGYGILTIDTSLEEGTIKKSNGKWTNKGKDGEHGEFDTKKQADAQRKAMFANGYKG